MKRLLSALCTFLCLCISLSCKQDSNELKGPCYIRYYVTTNAMRLNVNGVNVKSPYKDEFGKVNSGYNCELKVSISTTGQTYINATARIEASKDKENWETVKEKSFYSNGSAFRSHGTGEVLYYVVP